ncbi:MAG: hypothetical protein U0Q03_13860 [Acidimicrobiales bacterium]
MVGTEGAVGVEVLVDVVVEVEDVIAVGVEVVLLGIEAEVVGDVVAGVADVVAGVAASSAIASLRAAHPASSTHATATRSGDVPR